MLRRLLHRCAGADEVLLYHPDARTDHAKYVGVGAAVLFTAVFAWLSAGFALSYAFPVWAAVGVGAVWALFIFSLDRYIVATMRKGQGWQAEWRLALPRFAMAVFLALVISKPLELRIFQPEIEGELRVMDREARTRLQAAVRGQVLATRPEMQTRRAELQARITRATARRDSAERAALAEKDGTGGSRRYGDGPAYRSKRAFADAATREADSVRRATAPALARVDTLLGRLEDDARAAIRTALARRDSAHGLLARIEALARLRDGYTFQLPGGRQEIHPGSPAMNRAGWALTLLFVLLETAPVLVKLLSPTGPYDYLLNAAEARVRARERTAEVRADEDAARAIRTAQGETDAIVAAQVAATQDVLTRVSAAQAELAQEVVNRWKNQPPPPVPAEAGAESGG